MGERVGVTNKMPDTTNQRVTNAVLKKDIESLSKRVGELGDELRADKERSTKRMAVVEGHVIKCSTLWEKHDTEHARVNGEIAIIKGDVKKWSSAGGFVGAIAAIIASQFMDR